MPTISLFTQPKIAEASHEVRAPGGYERWRFIALDQLTKSLLIATFSDGDLNDDQYRSRIRRFVTIPTRTRPPLPRDFASVSCSVFDQAGHEVLAEREDVPRGAFSASVSSLELRANLNSFQNKTLIVRCSTSHVEMTFDETPTDGTLLAVRGTIKFKNIVADFAGVGVMFHRFNSKLPPRQLTDLILAPDRVVAPLALQFLRK